MHQVRRCFLHCLLFGTTAVLPQNTNARRPLGWQEIIELAQPSSPQISPDGQRIVYSLRQASLSRNTTLGSLWLTGPGLAPRHLLDETGIGVVWAADSRALLLRTARDSKSFWRLHVEKGELTRLFEHHEPIGAAWWSPDRNRVLFTSSPPESQESKRRRDLEGFPYDETQDGIRSFTRGNWARPNPPSLWLWEPGGAPSKLSVANTPSGGWRSFVWSPDGSGVVVEFTPPGAKGPSTTHLGWIRLSPGSTPEFRVLVATEAANRGTCVAPNGLHAFFASTGSPNRYYESESNIHMVDLATGAVRRVPTNRPWRYLGGLQCATRQLFAEYDDRPRSSLFQIELPSGRTTDLAEGADHLSQWHLTPDLRWATAVRQDLTVPPEIARIDMASGRVMTLTNLNPVFRSVELAGGIQRSWTNRFGHTSNGFLFLPRSFQPGAERLPLIVIQYEFSNKFTTQAQWMTSYPVQHFVQAGFAVLLHNYPREIGWTPGDFKGAAFSQAQNPLASLEIAVTQLIAEKIVDPQRVGIAGWSFGSYLAELALTQTNLFQAGSAGEGGLNNAGQYWVTGSKGMQDYLDAFFGGPPFGPAYANYLQIAPALNVHKLNAPLLREYGTDVGVQSLEFFMAARRMGKTVEQIIYPGAPHIFDLPSHRLASMRRNLDWFRFWLQGIEDSSPEKAGQYRRWRQMREDAKVTK